MNKRIKTMKISQETLERLKKQKRELSQLENRDLSMGEIVDRITKDRDIEERLRIGARERRRLLR
jgi:hypothetical protein